MMRYRLDASRAVSENPAGSGRWLYNAQTTLAGVRVSDRPGGVGEETAEKALG